MFAKTVLPSGLRLITVPMPAVKSAAALVMIAAGSRYEAKKINGLSHFLEHMCFKGTEKRPSARAISSLIDGVGGSWNASTGKEDTCFYIKAEGKHLELMLDVLSDMLFHSLYAPVELNKERGVIMEEINMYEDQPQERVGEFFEELLYGNQALAGRVIGEKEIIQKIGAEDMRDYVQNMYHARAMVVGIAGHAQIMDDSSGIIDKTMENRVGKLVTKYFGKVAGREENKYAPIREKQTKPAGLVHYKKTDQAHLILGVRAYDRHHPDRFALGMLATILGGNMSSRLFAEVREKRGLAYYVHAETEEFHDCGYLAAAAGVRIPEAAEAIKVILGEFGKVREAGVTEEELRRAKDYAAGKMALMLEDSFRVASFYTAQELLRRKIETPEEVLAQIKAVTPEDVRRVAKDIFQPQKLNLAVIGPFKKEGEFDRILKI